MRTKAQEWRRTRDSKRAEEQHCCSSKCSYFKEEGEEEVSWYTSSVPLVPPPSGETPWPSASQSIALCTPPRSSGPYAKWSCPWGRSQQGPPMALSSLGSHSRGAKLCGEGLARTCSVLLERLLQWEIAARGWGDPMGWGGPSTAWSDLHRVKCL